MKDFIMATLCTAVASGVIGLFFEGDKEISKYIKLVLSLCFICTIIPGALRVIKAGVNDDLIVLPDSDTDLSYLQSDYEDRVIETARVDLCEKMKVLIFENIGITADSIDIQFNVTENNNELIVEIKKVTLVFSQADDAKMKVLKEYIHSLCGVEPEISIAGEENI